MSLNADPPEEPPKEPRDFPGGAEKDEKTVQGTLDFSVNILATLRHAFLVLDKELRVVSANPAFCRYFQAAPEDCMGRYVYDLGDGQWNIPALRKLLEELLPQNHSFEDFEVDHEFAELGRRYMALNVRRVQTPGDHSELILLGIEDMTERRQAEEALRDSELRYRRLFQTAKDGILILNAHTGEVIDANAFMGALMGLEPEELVGKQLHEIGMFADIEENKAAFRELQRTKYIRYEHLPVQNRRGDRVEVEFIANVYPQANTLVAQCNVRDISERVKLEKQLAEQAVAMADESRRKDEFLAMLSHELRNPLAPIRSAVQLLRLHERGSENLIQQQAREIIERQVANLTKLVSDLLEVSRVVSGRIRLDREVVDLKQVVQHAIQTVTGLIEQRKHHLVLHLCHEPIWVNADATRIEEVLINLLSNAAKYTSDGGTIEVHCEHPRGMNYALMRVRDTGVGIDPQLIPRIFDLFTQADRSLDRAAGGLGVGLALAHRLVDLHGGTIEARSPPEGLTQGSEFIVRLGLVPAPEQPSPAAVAETPQRPDGHRVLVVDDNIDQVMMLTTLLQHEGYNVRDAYTGPEGLKVALQWRPDTLLIDIGLPGFDGYEFARRLRGDPTPGNAGERMRLIALTGYGRDTDIALAQEAGFDAHLVKPCDLDALEKLMAVPQGPPPQVTPAE